MSQHEMVWTVIHDEREALLADLEKLTPQQWSTPSLSEGWTVQQVVAHLTSSATTSKMDVAKALVTHKGNIEAAIQAGVQHHSQGTPEQTLEAFRAALHERVCPLTPEGMLGETVVHGEDIRRPLGIERDYPAETLRQVADYYKDSSTSDAKKRIGGVQLMATDQEWSHGQGPVVSGPMVALIMTMTGRGAYLDELSGDGLDIYRPRFTQ